MLAKRWSNGSGRFAGRRVVESFWNCLTLAMKAHMSVCPTTPQFNSSMCPGKLMCLDPSKAHTDVFSNAFRNRPTPETAHASVQVE